MQIVSKGDNLHEMSKSTFRENEETIVNLSSAELAQRVIKVKSYSCNLDDWKATERAGRLYKSLKSQGVLTMSEKRFLGRVW